MSKHIASRLATRLAAEKIFVEIIPHSATMNSHDPWWKRASTREPLEKILDRVLAEEFNAKFDYIHKLFLPLIECCHYCQGSGTIGMGVNNTTVNADCSACFPYREVLKILPANFPVEVSK